MASELTSPYRRRRQRYGASMSPPWQSGRDLRLSVVLLFAAISQTGSPRRLPVQAVQLGRKSATG